jgi:hypothetical protein
MNKKFVLFLPQANTILLKCQWIIREKHYRATNVNRQHTLVRGANLHYLVIHYNRNVQPILLTYYLRRQEIEGQPHLVEISED